MFLAGSNTQTCGVVSASSTNRISRSGGLGIGIELSFQNIVDAKRCLDEACDAIEAGCIGVIAEEVVRLGTGEVEEAGQRVEVGIVSEADGGAMPAQPER